MNKILIIEDDQIVANIYRNKFALDGFQVEGALDGQVGLEMVRSFRPDAVVLDLMLPRLTGVELMKRIRSEPGCDQLPLIVFSNTYLTAMVEEAWKAGATKCLSKSSCTPQQVIEAVRSTLANNGGGQAGVPARAATPTRAHDSVAPAPPHAPHSAHVGGPVDLRGRLYERGTLPQTQDVQVANILVVDDEAISRRAVSSAVEKAKLKSVNVESPLVAYNLLSENKFDLVFLDVDMPEMNGFELCTKLRTLPAHKKTPVVFVTSLNDFESRANSTMSEGPDFIAKPFLFIELAVKALVDVLRGRLDSGAQP